MCEVLQANVLTEKCPPSWSNHRNHLKYKKKDLILHEPISHTRTEEANHLKDKMDSLSLYSSKANLVDSCVPTIRERSKRKDKKNQKPSYPKRQNKLNNKIQKPMGLCYICGKPGHRAY